MKAIQRLYLYENQKDEKIMDKCTRVKSKKEINSDIDKWITKGSEHMTCQWGRGNTRRLYGMP
jgi:hypothetical protein